MKFRSTATALASMPIILFAFSCASTPPKPVVEPEKPSVVIAQEVPAPDQQKAAAEKARAEAAVYGAEAAFPEDWKAAAADFTAGEAVYGKDNAASRSSFEKALTGFTDLAAKAKPIFLESLANARKRAETARKQAFDLQAQSTLPVEWKVAESAFLRGRDGVAAAEGGKIEAYPDALKAYVEAGDAFESLIKNALPLFADALRAEIAKARADAVSAGAGDLSPDRLDAADKDAADALSLYQTDDFYGAYEAGKNARDRYYALATGARAQKVKAEIDRRGFAAYDSGNYIRATDRLQNALTAFDEGKVAASLDAAEEALLRFKLALAKGSELYAGERGKAAVAQKAAAMDLKAQVAVKVDYEVAADKLSQADASFKAGKWDDAADLYGEAEKSFAVVTEAAAQKRAAAEKALEDAKLRMEESERTARDADAVIEGVPR
jgi:hypothetical protein